MRFAGTQAAASLRYGAMLLATSALLWRASAQADSGQTAPALSTEQETAAPAPASTEELGGKLAAMEESFLETKSTVDKLKKFKLSGYVQAQYRVALDTMGNKYYRIGDFAGGAIPENSQGLFQVRRGRLKLTYETDYTLAVIQLDCTPSGVSIKDAYLQAKEPWLKAFAIKAGVFDRPFGFEIEYSSSSRESPERSRLFQTLFPGERDMGAELLVSAPDIAPMWARILNLKVAAITGNGIALENDDHRDVVGRIGFALPLTSINVAIDGGFSAYVGKVTNTDTTWGSKGVKKIDSSWTTKTTYVTDSLGVTRPVLSASRKYDTTWSVASRGFSYEMDAETRQFTKSAPGQLNASADRKYFGGDLQVYADIPYLGGLQVRGEIIGGEQPGTKASSSFYNPGRNSTTPVYTREFLGWYGTWVQNWGPRFQSVVKYDVYDPNTAVTGKDFDSLSVKAGNLSPADLMYKTLGLGLIFHYDEHLKFVVYYDKVANEKMTDDVRKLNDGNTPYTRNLKDDVLTMRIQYKF